MMGRSMYSTDEFAALEIMCRERATVAKKEMDFTEAEFWLAEAKEWKQLKNAHAWRAPIDHAS